MRGSVSVVRLALFSAGALAVVLAITACGSSQKTSGSTPNSTSTTVAPVQTNQTLQFASSSTDVGSSDPALAYDGLAWGIEYETCAKLLNHSDAIGQAGNQLTPDAAAGYPVVSDGGKTYTFTIRSGIRFSDGAPLTAKSFAAAMNRDANPKMNSPVDAFMTDVVGWNDVVNKKAKTIKGVSVDGDKLTIRLTQRDGGLLDKLAMPFFCAIDPAKTPVDPQGLKTLPGAGPYYIASRTVGKQLVLNVNPYYKGDRPHRASQIVITMNTDPQNTYLQVSNGTYAEDLQGLSIPSAASSLAKKYGINKGRFFVHPGPTTYWLALNTTRPPFSSVNMRKAVNYAIDRPALARVFGFAGAKPTTAILPPSLSGGVKVTNPYPLNGPNLQKAKSLAGGKCGNVNLWYATLPAPTAQAAILGYDLKQMGCNVTTKPFQGVAVFSAAGVKGAAFDAVLAGWGADYPDGYDFFHIILDGRTITASNNNNFSYFNQPSVNRKINAANELTGAARAQAWGQLDNYTMTNYAPLAPIATQNSFDYIGPNIAGYRYILAEGMDLGSVYLK
jgi:peptide/nickel transport system substrate-binding protein